MQIYKFGGTSLESPERLRAVKEIIRPEGQKIVVLSANGKVTDHLLDLVNHIENKDFETTFSLKEKLHRYYLNFTETLFETTKALIEAQHFICIKFIEIQSYFDETPNNNFKNEIMAMGELISSKILALFMAESGIENHLLNATEIIRTASNSKVNLEGTSQNFSTWMDENQNPNLIITQGFICTDHQGNMSNMGRGGSDYSATIFGNLAKASQIQIWSDVDGFLNNDPGFVNNSLPLDHISFDEAAELAYFGARILHPMSLNPAREAGIPVLLKNTLNPQGKGTLISNKTQHGKIKAVAAKDGITSITIHSDRMLLAYGFLKNIFEVFEHYKTPVDMVTTSEVSVSVTIDSNACLEEILADLSKIGKVDFKTNQCIVCVVGDSLAENRGQVSSVFEVISDIPIRMISYGAAKNSISFLVDSTDKIDTLRTLQQIIPNLSTNIPSYA